MSIRRTTTIHCDDCGEWEYGGESGGGESTASRHQRGWRLWREGRALRHRCPKCVKELGWPVSLPAD